MESQSEPSLKKIWVFTFEFAGIAKVGGLGEVSANQCLNLASEPDLNLQIFMPSHNRHKTMKDSLQLHPILDLKGDPLILRQKFDPAYFGLTLDFDDEHYRHEKFQNVSEIGYFEAQIWQGVFKGVSINLIIGVNPITDYILNDEDIYSSSTLNAKIGLFSLIMKEYMNYCIKFAPLSIPDILHIHDHHPVPALLCCRQELNLNNQDVPTMITMHLLSWPRKELDFFWKSGVNNELMHIQLGKEKKWLRFREIFNICRDSDQYIPPTLEKIGCVVADKVIAVSENFLHTDIIPNCGGDLIAEKTDFTWNGCDWDYFHNLTKVWHDVKTYFPEKTIETVKSWDLRKLFLTQILGNLPPQEPKITNKEVALFVKNQFNSGPYHPDLSVDAFSSDGPLVIVTGRVTPQKGVETLLTAIPKVLEKIPSTKFLFLMIPSKYTLEDLGIYMQIAKNHPENIRFIFGIAGSIFLLAHLSADVYCCPSRWEPFGIVALEAMASKIPVVATKVGGLQESIIDLTQDIEHGTGLLVPKENPTELAKALLTLLSIMKISQITLSHTKSNTGWSNYKHSIYYPQLRAYVDQNPQFGQNIRENALKRVEQSFRWSIVSKKLKTLYLQLAQ